MKKGTQNMRTQTLHVPFIYLIKGAVGPRALSLQMMLPAAR
jgi:hypothetical protein